MPQKAKKRAPVHGAWLSAVLAALLALSPLQAWGQDTLAGDGSYPPAATTYETRGDYLQHHLDGTLAPRTPSHPLVKALGALVGWDADALKDSGHTLYIKNTLFDASAAGTDQTLNAIYEREDWMSVIAGQYGTSADLLDPGPNSEYYIAAASATAQNGLGKPTDHVFSEVTNEGDLIESGFYDYDTGIAYVPKSLYQQDGQEVPFACQLQLLLPTDFSDSSLCATDVSIHCNDFRVEAQTSQTVESAAFDVTTRIPVASPETAGYIQLSDIHVRLNGSEEEMELREGQNASWDPTTGILEIAASPSTLLQADVTTDAPSLVDLFAEPAHATPTSSLAYVPDVVFDSLNLDTLTLGRALPFNSWIDYWWASPDPNDFQWQACVATGPYCYSWINDPTSLYEYIAWANDADWNGVSSQDVSSFFVDPNGDQASRNYFNYVFKFGPWQIEDQDFHSERWPVNTPYDNGYDWVSFGLQCSHTQNPVGSGVSTEDGHGSMMMRVLEVNTDAARPYVVLGFVGPSVANQPGVGIYKFEIKPAGDIEVVKSSATPDISNANPNYQMQGISYDVFSDPGCTAHICSISLDNTGYGLSEKLDAGTYYLRENAASTLGRGFAFDAAPRTVTVTQGQTTHLEVSDRPQSYAARLLVQKTDDVNANSTPQGDASLQGAVFEVRHYAELFSDASSAASLNARRTWVLQTDAAGSITLDQDHLLSGDALYLSSDGAPCLPLGTLVIREVSAPFGYRLDDDVRVVSLPSSGSSEHIPFTQTQTIPEEVERGGLLIEKRDAESGLADPLGAATLDGTTFEVRNASAQTVCVNGVMHAPGDVVCAITTQGGRAQTPDDFLPVGTYEVQEKMAGTGYLASDLTIRTVQIQHDHQRVELTSQDACKDQVKRGDLDFRKVLQSDQSRLANVPFVLESLTTGERHVLVSDDNGIVNTSATWHPHSLSTNANDFLLEESHEEEHLTTEEVDEGEGTAEENQEAPQLNADAGVWFGMTSHATMTAPDDALGALPYDTYSLTELRSAANEGLDLIRIEGITVNAHGLSVPLGDVEDRLTPPPAITTSARNAEDASKHVYPNRNASITDRIDYCNLVPGHEYELVGTLMEAETSEAVVDAEGTPVTSSLRFTAAASAGSCEVLFTFDGLPYAGERLVCFEELFDAATGEKLAAHQELSDYAQSIDVIEPRIATYASDSTSNSKDVLKGDSVSIVDAVSYAGLEEGCEYTLTGSLMRKSVTEDGLAAEPVLDQTGCPLTSTATFTPLSQAGTTEVSFTFDPQALSDGSELVAFETLTRDGRDLVVHEDPDNDAQTVTLHAPAIATHAFEKECGGNSATPDANLAIADEVAFENLIPGQTYTLFGSLMRVTPNENGELEAEALLDASGNAICATTQFAPASPTGSVFVDFQLDATELDGVRLVVYERLVRTGTVVATHEEADAESQTIWVTSPDVPAKPAKAAPSLPQTGDATPLTALACAALLAVGAATFCLVRSRRRN